jgi:isoamylase
MTTRIAMQEGRPYPMGTQVRDGGVNFCVFSADATAIEVCLFDDSGTREVARHALHGPHDQTFHGFLPDAAPGLVYGLRAHGPYAPQQGQRFNARKLLLDPYAREIVGRLVPAPEHHGYVLDDPQGTLSFDTHDNAATALKARVQGMLLGASPRISAPRVAKADLVLYEMHVKSFTQAMPAVPDNLRGTYAGLAHPAAVAHLKALGVTTLSLLPVQYIADEPAQLARGALNHWGYNTLGFFAPDPRYATQPNDPSAVTEEFRTMVRALHAQGLEVVLDVVYNHTAEGDERGTTLSFRGLDHANYYRLLPTDASRCENLTGCGNTLNAAHPRVAQFVLDSLRYWVEVMGVDGFRFDLASVLGRTHEGFDANAAFFNALRQDPVLAQVHLIAEPWDAAAGGYQVGRFPGAFLDWNDKFRDTVRAFWLGRDVSRGEFARRFMASSDLFHHSQRRPSASVNFVAVHDGFTLHDLVSYSHKHNHANGEDNLDGRFDELCHNFGVEGPTDHANILTQRRSVMRALLATLLLAQGTPMLGMGDELGRTQRGNNNAYCQNGDVTRVDWASADTALIALVSQLTALRRSEPMLHHDAWFVPAPGPHPRAEWFTTDGAAMQAHDWHDTRQKAFACCLSQGRPSDPASPAEGSVALYIAFNAHPDTLAFALPDGAWQVAINTAPAAARDAALVQATLRVPPQSLVLLRLVEASTPTP